MEFALERTTQACVFGRQGSCTVNLPLPERLAVHKLIVHGERAAAERTKARKDIFQAAALAEYFLNEGHVRAFNDAWRDAIGRGKGWRSRALEGKAALLRAAPELQTESLWRG